MKIRFFISLCLIATILCSCAVHESIKNENYAIYSRDGKWYLEFCADVSVEEQLQTGSEQSAYVSVAKNYPRFDTISDMQRKIKDGNIPDSQIATLQGDCENNVLEICDPNNLCDLALPYNLAYDYIIWYGNTYSFEFEKTDFLGYVVCCDQETFNQQFDEKYVNLLNENCSVITDEPVSDRSARMVHYMTHAAELKDILYSITTEQSSIYIVESYVLNYFNDDTQLNETSESVPRSVRIFGNDGENYFYGWFKGFEERPSVEWLSSIKLVPCTTNIAS